MSAMGFGVFSRKLNNASLNIYPFLIIELRSELITDFQIFGNYDIRILRFSYFRKLRFSYFQKLRFSYFRIFIWKKASTTRFLLHSSNSVMEARGRRATKGNTKDTTDEDIMNMNSKTAILKIIKAIRHHKNYRRIGRDSVFLTNKMKREIKAKKETDISDEAAEFLMTRLAFIYLKLDVFMD